MKGLEALEHLKDVLYGLPEKDNLVIIEKELKALEIIKNKAVFYCRC